MFDRRRREKAENKLKELVCCPFGISLPSYVEQWRESVYTTVDVLTSTEPRIPFFIR